jgi:hypothetical protein
MDSDMQKIIVITADEAWSNVWHTQLHYAYQLSREYKIFYVNPPTKWTFKCLLKLWNTKAVKVMDNLYVYSYHNWIPSFFGFLATFINDRLNAGGIKMLLKYNPAIVWHFDPFRGFYMFRNKNVKHIYHVIDPFYNKVLDARLAQQSNLVVVTSPKIIDHYKKLNPNTILIPQGVDASLVSKELLKAKNVQKKLVLLGSLTDKVNYLLLLKIVKRTSLPMLIIGPNMLKDERNREVFDDITSQSNVSWTGPLAPNEYIPMLDGSHLGLITYLTEIKNEVIMRSPLKVISYISKGMSVLTNIDCEIPQIENAGIYKASTDDDYMKLIDEYINNGLPVNNEVVFDYLTSIRYDNLINIIVKKLYANE